jgi:calmodulin
MKPKKSNEMSKASLIEDDPTFKSYQLNTVIKSVMIREAFSMFDADGSGEIDNIEFEKLVISLGLELDKGKIRDLYKEIDSNRSGSIDMDEFTDMMLKLEFSNNPSFVYSHLLNLFHKYDIDSDGYIDKFDLIKASNEVDNMVSDVDDMELLIDVIKMFSEKDKIKSDYSDKVSKEEFINGLNNLGFIQEVTTKKDEKYETIETQYLNTKTSDVGNVSERDKLASKNENSLN